MSISSCEPDRLDTIREYTPKEDIRGMISIRHPTLLPGQGRTIHEKAASKRPAISFEILDSPSRAEEKSGRSRQWVIAGVISLL